MLGFNSYPGDTTVEGGVLVVNGNSIPDTDRLPLTGGTVGLLNEVGFAFGLNPKSALAVNPIVVRPGSTGNFSHTR